MTTCGSEVEESFHLLIGPVQFYDVREVEQRRFG